MKDEASERRQEELINRMGQAISQMNGAYAKAEKLMGLNPYVSKVLYALSFGNGVTQSRDMRRLRNAEADGQQHC